MTINLLMIKPVCVFNQNQLQFQSQILQKQHKVFITCAPGGFKLVIMYINAFLSNKDFQEHDDLGHSMSHPHSSRLAM